jgi:hypothetical protein
MDVPFGCGSALVFTGPMGFPGPRGPLGPTGPTGPTGAAAGPFGVVAEATLPITSPTGDLPLLNLSAAGFGLYELRLVALRRHISLTNTTLVIDVSVDGGGTYLSSGFQSGVQGFQWNSTAVTNTNLTSGFILCPLIDTDDSVSAMLTLSVLENEPIAVHGTGVLADPNSTTTPNPTRTLLIGGVGPVLAPSALVGLRIRPADADSLISGFAQVVRIALP